MSRQVRAPLPQSTFPRQPSYALAIGARSSHRERGWTVPKMCPGVQEHARPGGMISQTGCRGEGSLRRVYLAAFPPPCS